MTYVSYIMILYKLLQTYNVLDIGIKYNTFVKLCQLCNLIMYLLFVIHLSILYGHLQQIFIYFKRYKYM